MPQRFARAIRATIIHPSEASASTVFARAVGWRNTTSDTAHYRGVSITGNIALPIVVGFFCMTKADTTTCDAGGTRYVFTSPKDRCPVCCPDWSREDGVSGNHEQADGENGDDD